MGFDFHITRAGPKLIEVNTNAGGAFLNVAAHDAQRACCPVVDDYIAAQPSAAQLEDEIVAMFLREWTLARGAVALRTIAIVDADPRGQFRSLNLLTIAFGFVASQSISFTTV
jgi:hypothetical protein